MLVELFNVVVELPIFADISDISYISFAPRDVQWLVDVDWTLKIQDLIVVAGKSVDI